MNCVVLIHFLSLRRYFSLLNHYLELFITDTALKVSRSLYCFKTSISHGFENYFPRLWRTGISDAIFLNIYKIAQEMKLMLGIHHEMCDEQYT